jgi:dTDP-D-glucose 4,6-dehydratase
MEGGDGNMGAGQAPANLDLLGRIRSLGGKPRTLIKKISGQFGHDRCYAISSKKISAELGSRPSIRLEAGLAATVRSDRDNSDWISQLKLTSFEAIMSRNPAGGYPKSIRAGCLQSRARALQFI